MIKKLREIALVTVAIAAVIALFATGPEVATHQAQAQVIHIVNKAISLFGVNLQSGRELRGLWMILNSSQDR